jgi:ABC-type nitrate/sulfonate/bicarbonate transport system substrate-binding protein
MRIAIRLLSLLAILSLTLAACVMPPAVTPAAEPAAEAGATAAPAGETALIPVRIGSIAGASQAYIPILLRDHGIGEKYGFAVEITELTSTGQQWTGLRAGDFDLATGSFLDLLRQRQGGLGATAIRGFSRFNNPIVALPDKPYESLADLAGTRIGTPNTALLDWMIIRAAGSKAYGVDIETEAEAVNASPPLISELLANGEIDAAFQFKTFAIDPVAEGTLKQITDIPALMTEAGFDPDSFYLTYNLADSWRQQHPEAVPALIAAIDEAVDVLLTDDSVWPELAASSGVEGEDRLPRFVEAMRDSFVTTFSRDKIEASQQLLDAMIEIVGEEAVGATTVDPAAFDFDSYEAAQELRE